MDTEVKTERRVLHLKEWIFEDGVFVREQDHIHEPLEHMQVMLERRRGPIVDGAVKLLFCKSCGGAYWEEAPLTLGIVG